MDLGVVTVSPSTMYTSSLDAYLEIWNDARAKARTAGYDVDVEFLLVAHTRILPDVAGYGGGVLTPTFYFRKAWLK